MTGLGPYSENTIVAGDCLEVMRQMPDGCVDLAILDPPYSSGNVSKTRNGRYRTDKFLIQYDEMSARGRIKFLHERFKPLWRILSVGAHVYCFSDWSSLRDVMDTLELSSLKLNGVLIWDKVNIGTGRPWRARHEFIIYASKSKPYPSTILNRPTILAYPRPRSEIPYVKPMGLIQDLIEVATTDDMLVFDPFMGSGTTAMVADRLGRCWFGCDINPEYVKLSLNKINQDRLRRSQLELPL